MKDSMADETVRGIAQQILMFGLVCLGVWAFSAQFAFDWSFLLCICVWMALNAARWVFK